MAVTTVETSRSEPVVRARGVSTVWWIGSVAFLSGAMLLGLATGPVSIGAWPILESALSHVPFLDVHSHLSSVDSAVVWQLRAPRIVLAALVGGMLAVAGAAYQGVSRNPLADPYLLGVAAGAGLGATIAIAYASGGSTPLLPVAAFAGGVTAVALAYALGRSAGGALGTGALLLAGVTVTSFMTAIQTFVQQEHTETLRDVYSFLLGGFSGSTWHDVEIVLPYIALSSVVIVLHRRLLDVLSVGDEEATALGLNVRRTRLLLVLAATLGTAAAVAVSGLIGFVGIIVPHTIRLLVSTSYRAVVPLSLILGGGFLVIADLLARTVMSPAELPIGVVTAFFGAPFFAVVLRTMGRRR
jgi:iron complex transport system permease protein